MSLVETGGSPLIVIGQPYIRNNGGLPIGSAVTQDATNEAAIMYGHVITDDGASHTIDTTGSSSLQWLTSAVTFANAGTTFVAGLAAMDTTAGPPGRAVNASDVITPSVSKSHTGGDGGVTANAWQTNTPDSGTLTIANGDFLAFFTQMTARGGADSVNTVTATAGFATLRPAVTSFTGGAYALVNSVPNALIIFSDGHRGWFYGGTAFSIGSTTQTWNSSSGTKEYGNFFQLPVPLKIYGLVALCNVAGNTDFVLYSDPLGTPVAERTVSVDLNTIGGANVRYAEYLFASPYTVTAGQSIAGIIKPTSGTNVSATYKTFNSADDQVVETGGASVYAINRNAGAFAAQNSSKDRFGVGLLVGAFDNGAGGSGIGALVGGSLIR